MGSTRKKVQDNVQVKKKKKQKTQKRRLQKKILKATTLGIDAGRVQARHRAHLTAAVLRAYLTAAGQAGLPGTRAKSRAHAL